MAVVGEGGGRRGKATGACVMTCEGDGPTQTQQSGTILGVSAETTG